KCHPSDARRQSMVSRQRFTALILMLVLIVPLLAACGGGTGTAPTSAPAEGQATSAPAPTPAPEAGQPTAGTEAQPTAGGEAQHTPGATGEGQAMAEGATAGASGDVTKIQVEDGAQLRFGASGNPAEQQLYQQGAERFNKLFPNVKLTFEPIQDYQTAM